MAIKKLPQYLINILKAGEIVERPSSVVKELLENAFDAGADEIKLSIQDGGKKMIQVIDNGTGIEQQDLNLTIERYATSKITDENDLYTIRSYGFRGEALASIAEVSKFTIQTKTRDTTAGFQLQKLGENINISNIPFDKLKGTIITVQDLFFNTPVREKFLKSTQTEWNYIYEIFVNFALFHYDKKMILQRDGKVIFDLQKVDDLYQRIFDIYSKGYEKNIKIVEKKDNVISLYGLVSDANLTFLSQDNIKIFVNKRPVNDKIIKKAIFDVYQRQLPPKEYPFALLFLEIEPNLLDVNVHPRKIEVKFLDSGNIYNFVKLAISELFDQNKISGGNINLFKNNNYFSKTSINNLSQQSGLGLKINNTVMKHSEQGFEKSDLVIETQINIYKIIGQIWDSYIILQDDNNIYFVDQHALAERISFEKMRLDFEKNKGQTSILLTPVSLQIGKDIDVQENIKLLNSLGFDISMLSENSVVVYAVPKAFEINQVDIEKLLNKLMYIENIDLKILLDEIWATKACKISIKSGEKLNYLQMEQLINDGFKYIDGQFVCQHGRPSFVHVDKSEILKLFDRN